MIIYALGYGTARSVPVSHTSTLSLLSDTMNSLRLPMGIPIVSTERFDALHLTKYIKNTGRAYQRQAIELVNACRLFPETSPAGLQGGRHPGMLKSWVSLVSL